MRVINAGTKTDDLVMGCLMADFISKSSFKLGPAYDATKVKRDSEAELARRFDEDEVTSRKSDPATRAKAANAIHMIMLTHGAELSGGVSVSTAGYPNHQF
jgi:hypothetical protein